MLRYAALVFILSSTTPGIFCEATGNIGCLFSETLCNQEKEWCYDDYAFGRCLPLYGNVREEDMHRYELGTEELHVLEREMQRLFLLGYRWSHTYTQCVLQSLLKSIRVKSEFDVSGCNAELDQDLEGALKAIEGEEMEHIDPKNLAIVRFTPSVINPHSDYADELYYPPVEEMLPPFRGKTDNDDEKNKEIEQQKDNKENQEQNEELSKSKTPSSPAAPTDGEIKSNKDDAEKPQPLNQRPLNLQETPAAGKMSNSIQEPFNLPPPAIPVALFADQRDDEQEEPYEEGPDDYEYDLGYNLPYSFSPNPVYKRTGYSGDNRNTADIGTGNYFRKPSVRPGDLRELAHMLSSLRPYERSDSNRPPMYFPNKIATMDQGYNFDERNGGEGDQGYFREGPVNPGYRERGGLPGVSPNNKIAIYSPYDRPYVSRDMGLPELNPPSSKEADPVPDTIHTGVVKGFDDDPYQKDEGLNKNNNNNYYNSHQSYDNSVARFEKDPGTFNYEGYKPPVEGARYPWMDEINNGDNKNTYQVYKEPETKYQKYYAPSAANPLSPPLPKDAYYGQPPYPAYALSNYDYFDYPNYYDYGGEYVDLGPPPPWNFQRDERLDVKKPGPFFKSDNDFAFDYPEGGNADGSSFTPGEKEWMTKLDPLQGEALLMTKLRQGAYDVGATGNEQTADHVPDLLLTEEGYVEALSDDARRRGKQGHPKAVQQVASKNKAQDAQKPPETYVYISISGRFHSAREAEQLVHLILHLVGLDMKHIQNLSVESNQVMFKIKENSLGMTAAHLAERTEELRPTIKEKTGLEIIQAGVGTKTAMSAVVYSSGERQMLAAAAIVCGVCAALLVAATVLFFLRRHARSKAKLKGLTTHDTEASKDYQDLCRARMAGKGDGKESAVSGAAHAHSVGQTGHGPGQRISSLSKESDNGNNSPSSRSSTSSWSEEPVISNMDISTGHMVLSYMEDHLRNKDRLEQEWIALCAYEAEPCACNIAMKPENARKNRFPDVLPYDHNRVILNEHTNVSGSNYINASSITDHDPRNPAYIATQGPLASTAADFWQLVWEQGSVVIVMLTRLTENGQALSHRYWPEEGSELYHIYEVHLVSEHIWCDDYLVRSFYLKNVRTGETRTVTQFHFLSWPVSGVPASTKALLEFRRKVNKSYRGRSCPIIVHCSDGIGRTGTYCLIDMVLNRMSKGAKEIDIAATLEHIRDQRPNMVKTKAQFEFVLMAVAEEVHAILKALPQ